MKWKRRSTAGSLPPAPAYNVDRVLEPWVEPPRPPGRPVLTSRRLSLAAAAGLIVITGLIVHYSTSGAASDFVADTLYAVLVYLLLSAVFIHRPSWQPAAGAIVFCVGIEVLQLTGLPAALGEVLPPVQLLLGTTFGVLDLIAYVVGVFLAAAVVTWPRLD